MSLWDSQMKYSITAILLCLWLPPFSPLVFSETIPFLSSSLHNAATTLEANAEANTDTGEVYVFLTIKNAQPETVLLEEDSIVLETPNGIRSPATQIKNNTDNIHNIVTSTTNHPNSTGYHFYQFTFHPVNSMALYQLTQHHGDFEPEYSLQIKFINDNKSITLPLKFSEPVYSSYLSKFGMERNLKLHIPTSNTDQFEEKQIEHINETLSKLFNDQAYVRASPDQHIINGLAFRWRMYEESKKTVVALQFINHNKIDVLLDLKNIAIKADNLSFKPTNDFSSLPPYLATNIVPSTNNTQYKIRAGKRFSWKFKFDTPLFDSRLTLNIDGLQIDNMPIYALPIEFALVDETQW